MTRTVRPFRRQSPLVVRRVWSGFITPAYRRTSLVGMPHPLLGTSASLGLRLWLAGSPRRQAESRSSSYGRVVHLPLLSTSPHGDAVTFGYGVQTEPRRGLAPRGYRTLTSALAHHFKCWVPNYAHNFQSRRDG